MPASPFAAVASAGGLTRPAAPSAPVLATAATLTERTLAEFAAYVARLTPPDARPRDPASLIADARAAADEALRVLDLVHAGCKHSLDAMHATGQIQPQDHSSALRACTSSRDRAASAVEEAIADLRFRFGSP